MSRRSLGEWGSALDEGAFASAFASAAVFDRNGRDLDWSSDRLDTLLRSSADDAARAWVAAGRDDERIVVRAVGELDVAWVVDTLSRAPGAASVIVEPGAVTTAPLDIHRTWDWPLDVGFLDDPASAALRAAVEDQYWKEFVRFVDATRTSSPVDVLLVPRSVARTAPKGLRLPPIHTALLLGRPEDTDIAPDDLLVLQRQVRSAVAGAVTVDDGRAKGFLDALLFRLAHDLTLDRALFAASRAVATSRTSPVLLGRPEAFERARVSRVASALDIPPPRDYDEESLGQVDWDRAGARGLESLESFGADDYDWTHEGRAATHLARAAPEARRRVALGAPRYLQARVEPAEDLHGGFDVYVPDAPLEPTRESELAPGKPARLDVFIGARDERWYGPTEAFPSHLLPEDADGHELTVVVTEPTAFPEPRSAKLWLPRTGDSAVCSFDFVVPEEASFDARVTVLYRNRLLQTLRIKRDEAAREKGAFALTVEVEAVVRATFDGLGGTKGFDAALLFNDRVGVPGVTAFGDASTAYVPLMSLEPLMVELRSEVERITRTPDDFQQIDSEACRQLFVDLATSGTRLIRALRELPGMATILPAPGDARRRLQVVSIHPDVLIPVEFAYERRNPRRDAKLCPGWLADRARTECDAACTTTGEHVCPLGFWGLRHVIERAMYDSKLASTLQSRSADARFRSDALEGHLPVTSIEGVLFGYASRAANFDVVGFAAEKKALSEALEARKIALSIASNWTEWLERVKEKNPRLLLLLPHTDQEGAAWTLQIGDDALNALDLDLGYVADPPIAPPAPGPIVLLFGCRTAGVSMPLSSFVSDFRRANASVVVGTMGTVLGRHMAPAARVTVELLVDRTRAPKSTSVGELMVELRRRLLARDMPVGMTFVAYGDVDWQLGGSS
ncbi:MAG: hypothetical protein U0414_35765 [Polyangiaceae bacterium]